MVGKTYKEYGNDWIITESNSDNADVYFYRFFGTKEEVKQKLFEMSVEHENDSDELLCCPESKEDIEENIETSALFCTVDFEDYNVVLTAKDFRELEHK